MIPLIIAAAVWDEKEGWGGVGGVFLARVDVIYPSWDSGAGEILTENK